MADLVDVTGQRFGRLLVVNRAPDRGQRKRVFWNCLCDCGNRCAINGHSLRRGGTQSCGCLKSELDRTKSLTHGLSGTAEHRIWKAIKSRCLNPRHSSYPRYGGRGIRISFEWTESFESFLSAVGQRPSPAHSIDRIDNSRGYELGNCRWATPTEQARNTRRNNMLTHQGETRCISEWATRNGLRVTTLRSRLNSGVSLADALSMPVRGGAK